MANHWEKKLVSKKCVHKKSHMGLNSDLGSEKPRSEFWDHVPVTLKGLFASQLIIFEHRT
jgi:hypothetical protein